MKQVDRLVRAAVYELFVAGARHVDSAVLAEHLQISQSDVSDSLDSLVDEHRLVLSDEGHVQMAHPFSGVDTGHTATVGGQIYWSNCAWDAVAILALLGEGTARCPGGPEWTVKNGVVAPSGLIHLLVPAAHFWDDVVFT